MFLSVQEYEKTHKFLGLNGAVGVDIASRLSRKLMLFKKGPMRGIVVYNILLHVEKALAAEKIQLETDLGTLICQYYSRKGALPDSRGRSKNVVRNI